MNQDAAFLRRGINPLPSGRLQVDAHPRGDLGPGYQRPPTDRLPEPPAEEAEPEVLEAIALGVDVDPAEQRPERGLGGIHVHRRPGAEGGQGAVEGGLVLLVRPRELGAEAEELLGTDPGDGPEDLCWFSVKWRIGTAP